MVPLVGAFKVYQLFSGSSLMNMVYLMSRMIDNLTRGMLLLCVVALAKFYPGMCTLLTRKTYA